MRKLFNEFFYIPKHGKIREKVMLARIAATITIIVMCLIAMSFSAYAYFSHNIISGSNIIKAANFETNVQVQIKDSGGNVIETITPITSNYKSHKVQGLECNKFYTVTITPTDKSTAKTGFVIITAEGCEKTYHTQQLGVDESVAGGETRRIEFELMITEKTDVIFVAHWGTSSYYDDYKDKGDQEELYITNGDKVTMDVDNSDKSNLNKEDNKDSGNSSDDKNVNNITPPTTEATPPSTEQTQPAESTTPETTETSEPATEAGTTTTAPATEPAETTEATSAETTKQTQPAESTTPETTGTSEPATEAGTTTATPATEPVEATETTSTETAEQIQPVTKDPETTTSETMGTIEPTTDPIETPETSGTEETEQAEPTPENTETTDEPTTEANQ